MKVVLFCGGFGMRLREFSESIPKPMVNIGYRPILWHVMKYYAHYGHKDFILCLGWKADYIKQYFLNYDECVSNDFVLSSGGHSIKLLNSDIQDWNITFVDTGTASNIGQRLKRVEPLLQGDKMFLANYTDGLSDVAVPDLIDFHNRRNATATFVAIRPTQTFHMVNADSDGRVRQLTPVADADIWINGGFFVLEREIFSYLKEGEELVDAPFRRLAAAQKLAALKHEGFWGCMDTYKDKQTMDDMVNSGNTPWQVWKQRPGAEPSLELGAIPLVIQTQTIL
jgi:glucose-1-phosphate cytidylyltransferase